MTLRLLKVEEGLGRGETIFHALQNRTDEEKGALRKKFFDRDEKKRMNRETQEANVQRKEKEKNDKLLAKRARFQEDEGKEPDEGDEDRIADWSGSEGPGGDFDDVDEFTKRPDRSQGFKGARGPKASRGSGFQGGRGPRPSQSDKPGTKKVKRS